MVTPTDHVQSLTATGHVQSPTPTEFGAHHRDH